MASRPRLKITLSAAPAAAPTPEAILAARWARLHAFLGSVHALGAPGEGGAPGPPPAPSAPPPPSGFSYEELYGGVVDVCSQRMAAPRYDRLLACLDARAAALLAGVAPEAGGGAPLPGALLLGRLRSAWATFSSELSLTAAVFQHLDRCHVAALPGAARSLWDVGVRLWGEQLEGRRAPLLARAAGALCEEVERERRGDAVDRGALGAVVRMLGAVGLMARHVERGLLDATSDFYEAEGARLMGGAGEVAEFLLHGEKRLQEEVRVCGGGGGVCTRALSFSLSNILTATPRPHPLPPQHDRNAAYLGLAGEGAGSVGGAALLSSVLRRTEAALLGRNAGVILERGVASFLRAGRLEDLRRLFMLMRKVHREEDVRAHFSAYVKVRARARCAVGRPPPSPPLSSPPALTHTHLPHPPLLSRRAAPRSWARTSPAGAARATRRRTRPW